MVVDLNQWALAEFSSQGLRWPGLWVISGYRSEQSQTEENPLVPDSLHRACPSLAVDLRVGDLPATVTQPVVWGWLGTKWKTWGGRWGGDFSERDYNHFDLLDTSHLP
ncbi:unnamed protein product [marine sediment metagenome]|uniref:Peptidase M15C domain-containing protein n=1 Tax=marine sediment metagenome TaxID=412755 RepID=X1N7R8_9ZZZZ